MRDSGYGSTPVKVEMERNLIRAMENGEELFPGIIGYQGAVIPQIVNAILSHHDIVFSANPEEYSRSGKIISQLKDRIGSEIRTHYPLTGEAGLKIIDQEAKVDVGTGLELKVPGFMRDIVEQITIEARKSPHVNHSSGVSARPAWMTWSKV